jgi:hypothetical protein
VLFAWRWAPGASASAAQRPSADKSRDVLAGRFWQILFPQIVIQQQFTFTTIYPIFLIIQFLSTKDSFKVKKWWPTDCRSGALTTGKNRLLPTRRLGPFCWFLPRSGLIL